MTWPRVFAPFSLGGRPRLELCEFCGCPASAQAGWHRGLSFSVCQAHGWDLSRWNDLRHIVHGDTPGDPARALAELTRAGSQLFDLLVKAANQ